MKTAIIQALVGILFKILTSEQLKEWTAEGLDMLADLSRKSDNSLDDTFVVPLIGIIKEAFGLETTSES
ncbi:hypothetical protein [Desulfobacter postgatei]|uniref:hypothetical protein n=1 Tax=Desulfobacter postgatei TaxID=2293 RepID=UPI00259BDB8A|nr:hypothetical protein [uncultured Desulfobacter sp.]